MGATFDDLVREVREILRGSGLHREQVTFLSGGITNSALSIAVTDGTAVLPGVVEIDSEQVYVLSVSSNTLTVAPDGRGWNGTTAASHSASARVTLDPPYPTKRIQRALNDTIVGVYPDLFGVGVTSFDFNPSITTYSLPADAMGVLQVTATVLGPSKEQAEIHGYKFNSTAPTSEFATGNCITLREAPVPGRTVTVVYRKEPTELVSGDDLTDSGLADSARRCLIYGAAANLLATVDASRATAHNAVAEEAGTTLRIGSATQLAAQMTARYQLELDKEQSRQRLTYPPKWRWIGR